MIETCPNHPQLTVGLQHCTRCGRSYCPDCLVSFRGGLYDAACKDAQLRDFAAGHSALKIASPWSRLGAAWIDGFVLIIPIGAIYYVSFLLSDMPFGAFIQSPLARWGTTGVISIVYILYDGILIARRGATVGCGWSIPMARRWAPAARGVVRRASTSSTTPSFWGSSTS